jgi:hypothetical protein
MGLAGSVASGAATGAGTGMAAGPVGAGVGAIAGAMVPLIMAMFSNHNSSGQDLNKLLAQVPQLRDMLNLQTRQAQRQDPLHLALTQLATNMLPRSAFTTYDKAGYGTYSGRPNIGDYGMGAPTERQRSPSQANVPPQYALPR